MDLTGQVSRRGRPLSIHDCIPVLYQINAPFPIPDRFSTPFRAPARDMEFCAGDWMGFVQVILSFGKNECVNHIGDSPKVNPKNDKLNFDFPGK